MPPSVFVYRLTQRQLDHFCRVAPNPRLLPAIADLAAADDCDSVRILHPDGRTLMAGATRTFQQVAA